MSKMKWPHTLVLCATALVLGSIAWASATRFEAVQTPTIQNTSSINFKPSNSDSATIAQGSGGSGTGRLYLGPVASGIYVEGATDLFLKATNGASSVVHVDQGNLTNILGLSIDNIGPGTTGMGMNNNSLGGWNAYWSGCTNNGEFCYVTTNNAQGFEVRNEAFSPVDFAFQFQASALTATKTFMRWTTFSGQTGDILQIQNSTPTTIAKVDKDAIFYSPTFVSNSSAPSLAAGANAYFGTLASTSVTGTNYAGRIAFTTGTLGTIPSGNTAATAEVLKLTFASSFTAPNGCVVQWYPMGIDSDAATKNWAVAMDQNTHPNILWGVCSTTTCSMYFNGSVSTGFANSTAYKVGYHIECF